MSGLRIRKPFAAAFIILLIASAYLGLSTQKIPSYGQSDKGLHLVTFFLLTATFYWVIETSRRRVIHLTVIVSLIGLGVGSEILQGLLPNGRYFDPFDILANVVGSALALALCSWYHKRMLERRRKNKHYDLVPGEELGGEGNEDLELGEGPGVSLSQQESGTIDVTPHASKQTNVTEELDNWDENAEDGWDESTTTKGDSKPDK